MAAVLLLVAGRSKANPLEKVAKEEVLGVLGFLGLRGDDAQHC